MPAAAAGAALSAYRRNERKKQKRRKRSKSSTRDDSKTREEITSSIDASETKKNEEGEKEPNLEENTTLRGKFIRARFLAGEVVNNFYVQMFVIFLIVVNSLFMGIATYDFVTEFPENEAKFEIIDSVFLYLFTLELFIQFLHHGVGIFLDGWLFFDFAVVMLSWVSNFMNGANLQVMRAFRIFRAFRLITRIKTMRALVAALIDTVPNMSAIVFLLTIINYIFAVMFTSLYKELPEGFDEEFSGYFLTLTESLFTLFQLMTMDGWSDICREIMKFQPLAWIPFVTFVVITAFVALNLVIAVICDAVGNHHEDTEEEVDLSSEGSYLSENEIINEQIDKIQKELDAMKDEQENMQFMLSFINVELMQKQIPIEVDQEDGGVEMTWGFQFKE